MRFEWDPEKEKENIKKHGINFRSASAVFQDKFRFEFYDENHSSGEDRFITIGMAEGILFVVFTERHGSVRLISARAATKRERRLYYDGSF